jgi:hypothetical protein
MGNISDKRLRRVGRTKNRPSNEYYCCQQDKKYPMKLSKAELDYLESQTKM